MRLAFDKKKKNAVGHIYRPINDFCDNFLIECFNKIALLDNDCILMGNSNIDLLKSNANNGTSKFLEVVTSYFFCSLYSATYTSCWFVRNTNR